MEQLLCAEVLRILSRLLTLSGKEASGNVTTTQRLQEERVLHHLGRHESGPHVRIEGQQSPNEKIVRSD